MPPRATLSVCVLTSGNAVGSLAAILERLRPVADEIIVALDDRHGDVGGALGEVCDRIVLFPHEPPGDRPIPWLFGRCNGEWIFNIDDDEVPSGALVDQLPGLIARSDITHYWIARRWLYPSMGTFLAEPPWSNEYQLRLVRSDPRFLRFSDVFHRPVVCEGPMRFVEAPLWHLDTAINSREERLQKAACYDECRGGMRIAGLSHNTGFYVPELRPAVKLADVPQEEHRMIESVLAGRPRPGARATLSTVSRAEIDDAWPGAPVPPSLYDASIELVGEPAVMIAEARQTLDVRITNRGDHTWTAGDRFTIGVYWTGLGEAERTALPSPIDPGETIVVPVHLDPPGGERLRTVEIDLVHEHVRWFGRPLRIPIRIAPPRRVALLGEHAALPALIHQLALVPELEPVIVSWGDPLPNLEEYRRVQACGPYLFGPEATDRTRAVLRALRLVFLGKRSAWAQQLTICEKLLILADGRRNGAPPTREALHVLTTALIARRIGLTVTRTPSTQVEEASTTV